MLDKLEWMANHILTRIFGGALMGGSAFALYEEILTQWPALLIFLFGVFCAVPTKFRAFFKFLLSEKKDAIADFIK